MPLVRVWVVGCSLVFFFLLEEVILWLFLKLYWFFFTIVGHTYHILISFRNIFSYLMANSKP